MDNIGIFFSCLFRNYDKFACSAQRIKRLTFVADAAGLVYFIPLPIRHTFDIIVIDFILINAIAIIDNIETELA